MTTLTVFEGPLCCNTGVCGPDPDQALVDFTADLAWLKGQGVDVVRANLSLDPQAFADDAQATAFLQAAGADGLPLLLVDGVTVLTGRYPSRDELARFGKLELAQSGGCCGGGESTSCCSTDAATPENPAESTGCCTPAEATPAQPAASTGCCGR